MEKIQEIKQEEQKESTKWLWHIWLSYACYYFGRVNLSIITPVIIAANLGLTKTDLGLVASCFFFAYMAGQFLHGQISERFNPFKYVAIGLILSAIMNVFMGFAGGYLILLIAGQLLEGLTESMGWSSTVRSNAIVTKTAGRDMDKQSGLLGTSYQFGNSIAWLLTAFAVGQWGWQAGFFLAAAVMFIRGITLYFMKHPHVEQYEHSGLSFWQQLKNTFTPVILVSGFCMILLNMVRYGVITWIPTYLVQVQHSTIVGTGLKICLIPIAGILGTLLYSKIDKWKEIFSIISMICLAGIFYFYGSMTGIISVIALIASGFFLYPTHVFLVTTVPSRFLEKKVVAASAGMIDGFAYIGAIIIGSLVPYLIKINGGGWSLVFNFWTAASIVVAIVTLGLYIYSKRKRKDI